MKKHRWTKGNFKYQKSPGAPKQPLSSYFHFLNDCREAVRKESPDMLFKEISKKITQKWFQLEQEEKEKYAKIAELDKERYSCEFLEFQQTDNYKKFISKQEAANIANGDMGKAMPLSSSKESKKKDEHVLNVHEGKNSFKCDICELMYAKKQKLNKHTKKVHGKNTSSGDPGIAMKINNEPTPKREKPYQCAMCNTEFEKKVAFNEHISNFDCKAIFDGKKSFNCDLCEKAFASQKNLNRHIKNVHKENTAAHRCQICNKYFSKKHGLKIHTAIVHEEINPFQCGPFLCNFCGSNFGVESKLKFHIQAVHEGTKPFQCHLCDSKFFNVSTMNMHIKVHKASNIISTRHSSASERLLAAQNPLSLAERPHQLFATPLPVPVSGPPMMGGNMSSAIPGVPGVPRMPRIPGNPGIPGMPMPLGPPMPPGQYPPMPSGPSPGPPPPPPLDPGKSPFGISPPSLPPPGPPQPEWCPPSPHSMVPNRPPLPDIRSPIHPMPPMMRPPMPPIPPMPPMLPGLSSLSKY